MIQALLQQLHREIRTASYLLHPPTLDENGLAPALSWYVQGLAERSGLEIKLDIAKEFGRLPGDMETGRLPAGRGMPHQYSPSLRQPDSLDTNRAR